MQGKNVFGILNYCHCTVNRTHYEHEMQDAKEEPSSPQDTSKKFGYSTSDYNNLHVKRGNHKLEVPSISKTVTT